MYVYYEKKHHRKFMSDYKNEVYFFANCCFLLTYRSITKCNGVGFYLDLASVNSVLESSKLSFDGGNEVNHREQQFFILLHCTL